ncbi:Nucleotidyltransferase [Cryphonectria parasitica EP155]|uniref:DNA polymerase n=1 Tax=Cryphonectria parasitica (strain ATCC 38755 / EP155) TaxID=660469 RepID=A0A9P4XSP7_CRYP1|nr:Nucleotidyltransferase [Cryphonectria parasitica EP155]KAF3760228.1 Nucleotidyltransferase [Cryphonectria parasitica EP155]
MVLKFPPVYFLPTHMSAVELRDWEAKIPNVSHDASRVNYIVGKISQKQRAQFELRKLGLPAEEYTPVRDDTRSLPKAKRRKLRDVKEYALCSDSDDEESVAYNEASSSKIDTVRVVRFAWLEESMRKDELLDYRGYLVYEAVKESEQARVPSPEDLMQRAMDMAAGSSQTLTAQRSSYRMHRAVAPHIKTPALVPHSTVEEHAIADLPPVPEFLKTSFSCQRSTRVHPPNESFIEKLKEVRELRAIQGDDIGVRAYSSAIASLSAYPYKIQSAIEIGRLPGCGAKFARLFEEFEDIGQLRELQAAVADPKMSVIRTFYNIWGVSAVTAEEFYRKGWRDLDDVVEFGWDLIHRSQQIGVKYYNEFLQKIPRAETEAIANTVLEHANGIREGFQVTVVGGYRRGRMMSGDVDLMLSHRDEDATYKCIKKLVTSLIDAKHITHTLSVSEHNSERGQRPTSFKGAAAGGTGFDTLDKALVVWQEPQVQSASKNTNPHRRVDILVSPWKTVGCAVLGWSSETTFQRDLRRYCKMRGLKFDSSGIRSRQPPFDWVDLEDGGRGPPTTMEEAERRVFEGLELEWRPPDERCTG